MVFWGIFGSVFGYFGGFSFQGTKKRIDSKPLTSLEFQQSCAFGPWLQVPVGPAGEAVVQEVGGAGAVSFIQPNCVIKGMQGGGRWARGIGLWLH